MTSTEIQQVLVAKMRCHVELGDALEVQRTMPDESVDAVVTDPPAGIAFMGKEWDDFRRARNPADAGRDNVFGRTSARGPEYGRRDRDAFITWLSAIFVETYRIAKPGARMLCWAIPRTCGWTQTAIEDAGWLVENAVGHLFGSGFPKGKTQLKPALELWFLARKPVGKVPPLRIDECRVAATDNVTFKRDAGDRDRGQYRTGTVVGSQIPTSQGRWPANLVLSHAAGCVCIGKKKIRGDARDGGEGRRDGGFANVGAKGDNGKPCGIVYGDADGKETVAAWVCVEGCPVKVLDEQSGITTSGAMRHEVPAYEGESVTKLLRGRSGPSNQHGDTGTASRFFPQFATDDEASQFFYAAKASRKERNAGLDVDESDQGNHHPTVKSQALMRWLCRLIAAPGGVILDPFTGSGSTGVAALAEGYRFVGVERDPEYVEIARARLGVATPAPAALAQIVATPPVFLSDHPIWPHVAPFVSRLDFVRLPPQHRALALNVVTNCPVCGAVVRPFVPLDGDAVAIVPTCASCAVTVVAATHIKELANMIRNEKVEP